MRSFAAKPVRMLVRLQQRVQNLWQFEVRGLHVGHPPSRKRHLNVTTVRATYERSLSLRPHEEQHGCVFSRDRRHLSTHFIALCITEVVGGAGVKHEPETRSYARAGQ